MIMRQANSHNSTTAKLQRCVVVFLPFWKQNTEFSFLQQLKIINKQNTTFQNTQPVGWYKLKVNIGIELEKIRESYSASSDLRVSFVFILTINCHFCYLGKQHKCRRSLPSGGHLIQHQSTQQQKPPQLCSCHSGYLQYRQTRCWAQLELISTWWSLCVWLNSDTVEVHHGMSSIQKNKTKQKTNPDRNQKQYKKRKKN